MSKPTENFITTQIQRVAAASGQTPIVDRYSTEVTITIMVDGWGMCFYIPIPPLGDGKEPFYTDLDVQVTKEEGIRRDNIDWEQSDISIESIKKAITQFKEQIS
jgi:hypothetical protein